MFTIANIVESFVIGIDFGSIAETKLDSAYASTMSTVFVLTWSILQVSESPRHVLYSADRHACGSSRE